MKKPFLIHPFVIPVYPVLYIYSNNMSHITLENLLRPMLIAFLLGIGILGLFTFMVRDVVRAGMCTFFLFLLLPCYQNFSRFLGQNVFNSLGVFDQRVLSLLLWLAIYLFVFLICLKLSSLLKPLTVFLNVFAVIMTFVTLAHITYFEIMRPSSLHISLPTNFIETQKTLLECPINSNLPNIYYIIPDAYAREDVLKEIYGYDNSEFIQFLNNKGFYVAEYSTSNYSQTLLSLASSLNLNYLDDFVDQFKDSSDRQICKKLIQQNILIGLLKQCGYKAVSFVSSYDATNIENIDVHYDLGFFPNAFEQLLINITPLSDLFYVAGRKTWDPYYHHRQIVLHTFQSLGETIKLQGPLFVFAHIVSPHAPYVFGANGEEINSPKLFLHADGSNLIPRGIISRRKYKKLYQDQLRFVTRKLMQVFDHILSSSSRPSIIILQADHGPGSMLDFKNIKNTNIQERMSILNAYYFPTGTGISLYKEITPVNTFRIVLNEVFGTSFELLEDKNYFSLWERPFHFIDVTDTEGLHYDLTPKN